MDRSIGKQAEELYRVFTELARGYQFRDKHATYMCDLTVSQCHSLECLQTSGSLTMGQLAGKLYLEVSTMTRVVDNLVAKGLVTRISEPQDRRVIRVEITDEGVDRVAQVQGKLIAEYQAVLEKIAPEGREAVLLGLQRMLEIFKAREAQKMEKAKTAVAG
ncbi:MAG: MarR family transcriptional regulator [Candidatus Neomarinimicrobiota bacterium]